MSALRRIAWLALSSGVAVSTFTDTILVREPIKVAGYEILSGDFHVHAFVGDGGIAPWMMQRHAARVGLDVVAITNHNQTLAGRLGRWSAQGSSGPLILVGEEITGRDYHLIAVGIERPVNWNQPARAAIADIHAQGGVAIAAHPLHGFAEGYDEVALATLDGLEAAHPDSIDPDVGPQFEEFYQRTLARNPEVAAIGSSDFHTVAHMGACRTYLLVRERSEAGVLDAIRDGRTVGYCKPLPHETGRLRGQREFVELVEPHRDALAPLQDSTPRRLLVLMVWVSLVALAIVGPRSS